MSDSPVIGSEVKELFKNRIIGYGVKRASEFHPNPLNFRRHPSEQKAAVRASLTEIGWISAVIENVRTGNLVDGHERVDQALGLDEEVPYLKVDLSEEEEKVALTIYDYIGSMAEIDAAILAELQQTLQIEDQTIRALVVKMADDAGLYLAEVESPDDFNEYDENLETEHTCPKCGYKFSGDN
jgi:hypothetical protein